MCKVVRLTEGTSENDENDDLRPYFLGGEKKMLEGLPLASIP